MKATHTWDALNRLAQTVYSKSGQTSITHSWTYDQTGSGYAYGIGRLTSTAHPAGSTQYSYNPQGQLLTDIQRVNSAAGANPAQVAKTVSYGYDAGNLTSIVYPSGRKLTISYADGQPTALGLAKDTSAAATPLISQIQWQPFGPVRGWLWHMASGTQSHERVFDTSGRVVRYRLGGVIRDLRYDAADRISSYTHYNASSAAGEPALDQGFSYDELGRLTGITTASASWSIGYDANGNRTSLSLNGMPSSYAVAATSNRLVSTSNPARSFAYDNAGNTTSDNNYTASYDTAGRMATLTKAKITSTYSYNGFGQRVRKFNNTGAASTVIFVYDQQGQLLGEYDSTGKALREYVWLGNTPVAMFTPDPANASNPPLVYYVHADHIDTPRVVVDKNNVIRWRWMAEPFGVTAAETNTAGLGNVTFNLRFPGQYFDTESGLHYNHHRYADATTNRYTTVDPLGLGGGSLSPYVYVENNPLMYIDPYGLWAWGDPLPDSWVDFGAGTGDVILFGEGQRLRDLLDIGGVDRCSAAYGAGEWAGVGASFATGVVGGIKAAGAKGAGMEFSHWIPARMGGPRTLANGNFVPTATHALSDPYRYRFMPRVWKAANPMPNKASQQWTRIPNVYKGAAAGGAYGAGGAALADCTCRQ